MKLPILASKLPAIKLSQRSANLLVGLYYEMVTAKHDKVKFDQNKCSLCVIGNGIRSGFIDDKTKRLNSKDIAMNDAFDLAFDHAVNWIGISKRSDTIFGDERYEAVQDYLFGGSSSVEECGEALFLPIGVKGEKTNESKLNAADACVRIAAVLDRAGYDITELPKA